MPATPNQAIASCAHQSMYGPAFGTGLCKQRTRMAYEVASSGVPDAAAAWYRTKHRVPADGAVAPRGALLWWLGGSEGHGHVAIADGKGGCWSVDILRPGYWGHIADYKRISKSWPLLHFVGASLDIEGVQVVPTPDAKPITKEAMNFFSRFRDKYNHENEIDLNLLDKLVETSGSKKTVAAAKACRWACIQAVRTLVKVVG